MNNNTISSIINFRNSHFQNNVLVSVIVPVYNVERYLERCLQSIINQTFTNIEIICVNDGSTDSSGKILEEYAKEDSRIIVISKENGGLSSARNAALPYVKSKFIYFVDSDDWIEKNALEECLSRMTDDIDIVISGAQIEDEGVIDLYDPNRIHSMREACTVKEDGKYSIDDNLIVDRITSMPWGKLLKYDILKQTGLRFFEGHKWEDIPFTAEYCVHAKKCYFISKNLYHYVQRKDSIVFSKRNQNDLNDFLYVFDYLYKRLDRFGLLGKHKKVITHRYILTLTMATQRVSSHQRECIKELATRLARNYNPEYFNDDLVVHVQKGEYGLVPQFDEDVFLVLNSSYAEIKNAFNTINSLFTQSYKLPKILLNVDDEFTVTDDTLPKEVAKYIDTNLFISFNNEFTLEKLLNDFPNHIVLPVKSGIVYPDYWLRCVMDAYINRNNHFQLQSDLNNQLSKAQNKAALLNLELKNIKNGPSFIIGRVITYIPRKIRAWLFS